MSKRNGTDAAVLQHAALAEAFAVRYQRAGDPDVTGLDTQALIDGDVGLEMSGAAALEAGDTTYMLSLIHI